MIKKYTIEEVNKHNTKDDCWIIVKNNVYNMTEFSLIHPGGKNLILSVAGKDATEFFDELHRPEILDEVGKEYLIGYINENKL
jgi:cytochrome b involved in lipid metabolism